MNFRENTLTEVSPLFSGNKPGMLFSNFYISIDRCFIENFDSSLLCVSSMFFNWLLGLLVFAITLHYARIDERESSFSKLLEDFFHYSFPLIFSSLTEVHALDNVSKKIDGFNLEPRCKR